MNPLAELLEQALEMVGEDQIDKMYLLEALLADLKSGTVSETQELINNPVS